MTQEEKQLLLKDLCERLPYGVKVKCPHWDYERDDDFITIETLIGIDEKFLKTKDEKGNIDIHSYTAPLSPLKPYLRPMSNMTEEEKSIMDSLWKENNKLVFADPDSIRRYRFYDISVVDFLNKRHLDYRGLIEKGLALEAKEGMYKTE